MCQLRPILLPTTSYFSQRGLSFPGLLSWEVGNPQCLTRCSHQLERKSITTKFASISCSTNLPFLPVSSNATLLVSSASKNLLIFLYVTFHVQAGTLQEIISDSEVWMRYSFLKIPSNEVNAFTIRLGFKRKDFGSFY